MSSGETDQSRNSNGPDDGDATRRQFLRGACLTVGFAMAIGPQGVLAKSQGEDESLRRLPKKADIGDAFDGFAPGGFIRIPREGKITLVMPYVEMGQGIYTGAAMLLAEELEVGLDQVELVAAPPNEKLYAHPIYKTQMTGGSTSTRAAWVPLRKAGAAARSMLIAAAARRWSVSTECCEAREGRVHCRLDGQALDYGSLVETAALLPVPSDPPLKPASQYRLIGRPQHRLDAPSKVNGEAVYAIDVRLPGMKVAVLEICPYLGGRLIDMVDHGAREISGVADVLRIDNAVAVTGDHFWAAKQGLSALTLEWARPSGAVPSTDAMIAQMRELSHTGTPLLGHVEGDVDNALDTASDILESHYQLPLFAHAAMEPLVTTVHVRSDECELWLGTQSPVDCQTAVAKMLGMTPERVILHNLLIGGAFGRRLSPEMVVQAVAFARQVSYPLKVMWTRQQDLHQDRFKPFYYDRIAVGFEADGFPKVLTDRICGPSVFDGYLPGGLPAGKIDSDAIEGVVEIPYAVPSKRIDWVRSYAPLQFGWWRGVGPAHNVFVLESFIDECAHRVQRDPVEYRRAMLRGNPRALNVLDIAAQRIGWGRSMPRRRGFGISLHQCFGSHVALACEVEISASGEIRLRRLVAAVDAGQPTNPDSIVAQIEGGVLFGLSAALFNSVTVTDGRIDQNNFNDYRQLRINEVPPFEVHLVKNAEAPGGIGEAGVVSAAPALGNAIFAATGVRVRQLPFVLTDLAEKGADQRVIAGSLMATGFVAAGSAGLFAPEAQEPGA